MTREEMMAHPKYPELMKVLAEWASYTGDVAELTLEKNANLTDLRKLKILCYVKDHMYMPHISATKEDKEKVKDCGGVYWLMTLHPDEDMPEIDEVRAITFTNEHACHTFIDKYTEFWDAFVEYEMVIYRI